MSAERSDAEELADLLTSGVVGTALMHELWSRFSAASRADVFLGIALAATLTEAQMMLVTVERDQATGRLAA